MPIGSPPERTHGEDRTVGGVRCQGISGHPVTLVNQSVDELLRGRVRGFRPFGRLGAREHAIELGQEQRDRTIRARIFGAFDVVLQEVLDLLLAPESLGGVGRAFGVEAEQDGVAVGEEIPDRLVRAERHMLALVILEDQVEPRGPAVKPQVQIGLGQ